MIKKRCSYRVTRADGALRITLEGEIDHHSAVNIRGRIDAQIEGLHPQKTVMDLSGIEFMDSSGLGLIMGRYALMQKLGGAFAVKNPNPRIVKIFELAGLEKIVSIERSESEPEVKPHRSASRKRRKSKGRGVRNENQKELGVNPSLFMGLFICATKPVGSSK